MTNAPHQSRPNRQRVKRPRGAPKGNQNARKHGLYAKVRPGALVPEGPPPPGAADRVDTLRKTLRATRITEVLPAVSVERLVAFVAMDETAATIVDAGLRALAPRIQLREKLRAGMNEEQ